jgi:hypothetical protein
MPEIPHHPDARRIMLNTLRRNEEMMLPGGKHLTSPGTTAGRQA